MKTTLITACAAALLLAAGAASAQNTAQNAGAAHRAARADADRDGRISQAEFLARFDRMASADANGDGSISPDERRAAGQARRAERRDAAFSRLDADRDGSISRAEFDVRPQRAEGGPRGRMGHGRRAMHRGPAADAPMRAERTVDLAQARDRMAQAFARLDKDGDGYLTAEERRAGMMERRQHRRGMRHASPAAPASE